FALLLVVPLLLHIKCAAAADSDGRLSLADAIRIALDNNYEIKASKNALAAANEDIGVARSFLLPKLAFEERFMRTTNPTYAFMSKLNQERFASSDFAVESLNNPRALNDFQTSISFEQPLFAKKAYIGLRMAKLEQTAKNEDHLRKKEEIAFKVTQAYLTIVTAREQAAFAEKSLEDTKEHLRIAELRYKNGLGLFSDTLRASTAVTEAEQRLVSARKNLAIANKALSLKLGTDAPSDIAGTYPEIPVRDLEYYKNAALSRKDIKSMEALHENARNGIALSEAAYWPTLGVGGSYQLNDHRNAFGAEGSSWLLTAFLRWELFDGTRREHERAQARYRTAEEGERLKGLRDTVSFNVYASYLGIDEAKKNADLASSELKTAEEGKRLVQVRYENSLAPLVDLLDAQASLDHARANLAARESAYWLAVANLTYEGGTILRDLNIE
ncbi:MAG: TolC family protein, partial [Nitrospirae bacterium]|nr:TolC family protein [Nitrospirota bacterium]